MGVEPGAHQYPVRGELLDNGTEEPLERRRHHVSPRTRREREVDRVPLPGPYPVSSTHPVPG